MVLGTLCYGMPEVDLFRNLVGIGFRECIVAAKIVKKISK